jgi:hypothetical protein
MPPGRRRRGGAYVPTPGAPCQCPVCRSHDAQTASTKARPTPFAIPAYKRKLSDDEIVAVATFVRHAWGNAAPAVTADEATLRGKLHGKLQ